MENKWYLRNTTHGHSSVAHIASEFIDWDYENSDSDTYMGVSYVRIICLTGSTARRLDRLKEVPVDYPLKCPKCKSLLSKWVTERLQGPKEKKRLRKSVDQGWRTNE